MNTGAENGFDRPRGEPAKPLLRGNGELILVIDDDSSVRMIASLILKEFGYRILLAGDGAEGLEQYKQNASEISLVMTDMAMPIMDGAATISALIALDPTVKIIAVSGSSPCTEEEMLGRGVKHFLGKPYRTEALLSTINQALTAAA